MLEKTQKTSASRYASTRLHYDEAIAFPIIDEALFCTISYCIDNQPFSIQTSHVRDGRKLYVHGSVGSHFLRGIETGIPVCISIMLVDDLVVAKSAFNHSVNYRSVIIFSNAVKIEEYYAKADFFKKLTEKIVPGSWYYLRPMKESEVNKTMLLSFDIEEASAKVRSGESGDEDADNDLPIWSGRLPVPTVRQKPIVDERSKHIPLPDHLQIKL